MTRSSATFSSPNSFIFLIATPILLLLLAIIPGGRLAGEVEDKLAKVGQKVDEVGQGVGQVVDQLAKTEVDSINQSTLPNSTNSRPPNYGARCQLLALDVLPAQFSTSIDAVAN